MTAPATHWLIGREADCDLIIPHPEVSGRHCRLLRTADGRFWVEDLGSTNGTFARGQRIASTVEVEPGELVLLGPSVPMPWPAAGLEWQPTPANRMVIRIYAIQPDEDRQLVMWFFEIDGRGRVVSGLHGPSSPLTDIEPARDGEGPIEDARHPQHIGVRITTQSGSVYYTVLEKDHAGCLRQRLGRPASGEVHVAVEHPQVRLAVENMEFQAQLARALARGEQFPRLRKRLTALVRKG
jgi:pSer/pThr/pTyr-binding forkhead associated (FHA) protein